jgi:RNA polymerase sigma factor (sigma-70 family)
MTPDTELLTQYARDEDEATFAELVRRHLDHVHSTALRLVNGDAHLAEDVCQSVFADLARKAGTLVDCHALSSWLHTSARFAAAKLVRGEQRRRQREQSILAMPSNAPNTEPDWDQVRPILDETMAELPDADRDALSLRYFEKKPFADVGTALGLSENAARMRVERATEKLRGKLALRGITSTVAALGTVMAQQMVATAPASLGSKIMGRILAGAGAAGTAAGWGMAAKLGLAGLAVASLITVGVLTQSKKSIEPEKAIVVDANNTPHNLAALPANTASLAGKSANAHAKKHNPLELYLVDKQTGQPIPDQTIDLKGWAKNSETLVTTSVEVKSGKCVSPFDPDYMDHYWVIICVEGYAATRLHWQKEKKEIIPDSYTVQLEPPVLIRGTVVDPSGNPIENAEVEFSSGVGWNEVGPGPEDHDFEQIKTMTDAQGHWALNQIADDMLPRAGGHATHPKYSRAEMSVANQASLLNQLRVGSFVFHLGVAGAVTGQVINERGEPVPDALVRFGTLSEINSRTSRTDADGKFEVPGCKPGNSTVTAIKEGYAPSVVAVEVGTNSTPVVLTLGAGKALRLRMVDAKSRPIKGAQVWYDIFNQDGGVPLPQVEFHPSSDADGRVVWEHAPDVLMELQISAMGFSQNVIEKIRPDGLEHEVVLSQSLFIYGTVRSADSGELLPKFRLSIGTVHPERNGGLKPYWSSIDRFNPLIVGGQFRKLLDEPVIGRTTNMGFILRFEAEGYKPEVTRLFQPNEGAQELNISLHKGNDVTVKVYQPDGSIASGAEVGLSAPGVELTMGKGNLTSRWGSLDPVRTRVTDATGQFTLPDDDNLKAIVIVHSNGFASLSGGDLRNTRSARLDPWAKVTGILTKDGGPVASQEVSLMPDYFHPNPFELDFGVFRIQTDAKGKFEFPQVPSGKFQILKWRQETNSDGRVYGSGISLTNLELRGGEQKELSLDADTPAIQSKR